MVDQVAIYIHSRLNIFKVYQAYSLCIPQTVCDNMKFLNSVSVTVSKAVSRNCHVKTVLEPLPVYSNTGKHINN